MKDNLLALLGAVVGGALGYLGFFWIVHQGFYALVLPGAFVGLGAGIFKNRSVWIGVTCGLLALASGLFVEWKFAPFMADDSLGYFLGHLFLLRPITMIMIAAGTFIGFWVPFRRQQSKPPATASL
jgi:hypothetical protein